MKKLYIFLLIIIFTIPLKASVLESKISLHEENTTIIALLSKIEKILDITFSFKSTILDLNATVSITTKNETLASTLKKIIPDPSIGFSAIGTQVIIYKKPPPSPTLIKSESVNKEIQIDTIVITNTDTVHITLRDTIHTTDTIIIEKSIPAIEKKRNPFFLSVYYQFYQNTSSSETMLTEDIDLTNNRIRHNACYITGGAQFEHMSISTGIGIAQISAKGNTNYNTISENIETNEFLYYKYSYDSLWTISASSDTSWFIYKDSTLQMKTDTLVSYDTTSNSISLSVKHTYISIPILLTYKYSINKHMALGITAGLYSHIAIKSKTAQYQLTSDIVGKRKVNPVYLDGMIALNFEYSLFKTIVVTANPALFFQLTPIYQDENNLKSSIGFSVGLKKCF